jgi:hypothetical protein
MLARMTVTPSEWEIIAETSVVIDALRAFGVVMTPEQQAHCASEIGRRLEVLRRRWREQGREDE